MSTDENPYQRLISDSTRGIVVASRRRNGVRPVRGHLRGSDHGIPEHIRNAATE